MASTLIWCTFDFEAFHRWANAPAEHSYLRERHRHLFKCKAWWRVEHDDRQMEFIQLKREALEVVQDAKPLAEGWSCEQWAKALLGELDAVRVEVSEDGENGATVEA